MTNVVTHAGLLVNDQRRYTNVLQACCDLKARMTCTDDDHGWVIGRKLDLLATVLFPSAMIRLGTPEQTNLPQG
jgi:hypothetical protein